MRIIPAIDLLEGKCVRLFEGEYNKVEVFHEDPAAMAMKMEEEGLKYLHLVDLDGARGSGNNRQILSDITDKTNLIVDFGGGLRSKDDISKTLEAGAKQVNIGSMAVKDTRVFVECLKEFGDAIVWNADVKDGKLAIHGWQETVETSLDILLLQFMSEGLKYVLSTDVSKDGTLEGPNITHYKKLIASYPSVNWIASGGVSTKEDLVRLKQAGLEGAVVGKALYKKTITYKDLRNI